ncbi:MAG: NAD-dependent epimerase/dehydratase family protein [Halodesulfurarchaeum sp.]
MNNVLVTGALGQIGSELTPALRDRPWADTVVASDVRRPDEPDGPFAVVDVTDRDDLEGVIETHDIDTVFHLAAILSATGEEKPGLAYEVNVNGLHTVLEVARENDLERVVVPSSIAVFGPDTPENPGEVTVLNPRTIYGISKVFGEHLGMYYHRSFGLDVRGVRLPGIISHRTKPGGGTTDYAVEVFYEAVASGSYTYFVREDTRLPMMYMPDAVEALIGIAEAPAEALTHRCSYNVGALSFTAGELTAAIRAERPEFTAAYEPDERQAIADSWPDRVDDSAAREDWGWEPTYDLSAMVSDMLAHLDE